MQTLYALPPLDDHTIDKNGVLKRLHKHFDNSLQLLLYLLQTMVSVAQYAEIDARKRASKNLPTAQDLNINTRIVNNFYLQSILDDKQFITAIKKYNIDALLQEDIIKKLYMQLVASDIYQAYTTNTDTDKKVDQEIFTYILNTIMLSNSIFITQVEEIFANIDDDIEILQVALAKYLQKPGCIAFDNILGKEKKNFAEVLLQNVLNKSDYLSTIINPKLNNWDAERIAVLDMILLKMGLTEMLYFDTIPVKVTINEYIDIAKEYSTNQSGQFINGILDNIHRELITQNKINKVDFRQS